MHAHFREKPDGTGFARVGGATNQYPAPRPL